MVLLEKSGAIHNIPVSDRSEVYDVSGAGDTCVAVMILALAAGVEPVRAQLEWEQWEEGFMTRGEWQRVAERFLAIEAGAAPEKGATT